MRPPRKLPKAEREAAILHQRIAHDRAKPSAAAREKHLRELMGLPTATERATERGNSE
jgi:hypothetical protein